MDTHENQDCSWKFLQDIEVMGNYNSIFMTVLQIHENFVLLSTLEYIANHCVTPTVCSV